MIPSVSGILGEGIADSIYVCGDNPRDYSNLLSGPFPNFSFLFGLT